MMTNDFNPWKNVDNYGAHLFAGKDSELVQWPIKLWKVPVVSPYFHRAHLLIAADCSAFSCPTFHDFLSRGQIPLICCPEADFDITTKLSAIFSHNEIYSATVVQMDALCCKDLTDCVMKAAKSSRLPVPIQVTNVFVEAEEVD